MKQYNNALREILQHGEVRVDRTGVGTRGVFGLQTRYNLRDGFPAVTTKRLAWKPVVAELLWFLEGSTDERRLAEIQYGTRDPSKKTIWTKNALHQAAEMGHEVTDDYRNLGPVYGEQWRDFNGIDQIKTLIKDLRHNPFSRRHIVSAWNVPELSQMALPPCHVMTQWHVSNNNQLSCQLYQRSADMFLGVPFNIASYSLLTHIIAHLTNMEIGTFVHTIGDAHIYLNHVDQVEEQLSRTEKELPSLLMPAFDSLEGVLDCRVDDFKLIGYNPHPTIKAPMAI